MDTNDKKGNSMCMLLFVGMTIVTGSLMGCVPWNVYEQNKELAKLDGYRDAAEQCHREAEIVFDRFDERTNLFDAYETRLKMFHQLKEDGSLRPVSPCYTNPNDPRCKEKSTGKELWQK